MHYNSMQFNAMQYNAKQYNTVQYNTIQYNAIEYITILRPGFESPPGNVKKLVVSVIVLFDRSTKEAKNVRILNVHRNHTHL